MYLQVFAMGKFARFTVPVLFDKKTQSIVNNESSEIIRIFNTAFNDLLPANKAAVDIYPEALRKDIEESNEWVYPTVNSELVPLVVLWDDTLTMCV
jgi:glutathionyl-hydroquinone reductase